MASIDVKLDSIENQIVQLIKMVAENNKVVKNLEQRFDGLEQRFDGLEQRFDGLEQRFDGLEQRFDRHEQRFSRFEKDFAGEKELNHKRSSEILKEVRNTNFEIDYLRNQSSRHDMDIHTIKQVQQG